MEINRCKRKQNIICIIISLIPILVLAISYPLLKENPNTKVTESNGMNVSKEGFLLIIFCLSFLYYYMTTFIIKAINKLFVLNL